MNEHYWTKLEHVGLVTCNLMESGQHYYARVITGDFKKAVLQALNFESDL